MADEMVDLVRKTIDRLYDYYSCVDSSESERTHIEGDTIGCADPYMIVNSRCERFLEAEKFVGCSNEIKNIWLKIVRVEGM